MGESLLPLRLRQDKRTVGVRAEIMVGDKARFNAFLHGMLDEGVYFAPAMFEAGFVSAAHDDAVIAAARKVFVRIA